MPGLTLQATLIWLSCPILQLFCVYLLYRRKLLKQFAFFASYLILLTLLNVVRFLCYRKFGFSSWPYFSVYWVGTALANMAALAVLYASLLIWVGSLLKPEPSRESIQIPITSPLLRWNEVALQMGHSGGKVALLNQEPFMPQVERMVEKVLQKQVVERRRSRYQAAHGSES